MNDVLHTSKKLIASGYQARKERRPEQAKEVFSEAVRLSRKATDASLLASSLVGLGQIERDLAELDASLQHYREAVELLRGCRDRLRLAHTLRHLADIFWENGCPEDASPRYEEALKIYREHTETSPLDLANTLRGFALLKGAVGEKKEAESLWREARTLYDSVNVRAGVEESEIQIARLTGPSLPGSSLKEG